MIVSLTDYEILLYIFLVTVSKHYSEPSICELKCEILKIKYDDPILKTVYVLIFLVDNPTLLTFYLCFFLLIMLQYFPLLTLTRFVYNGARDDGFLFYSLYEKTACRIKIAFVCSEI
ncbi:hypothetical protein QTP88_022758 [Uroleucon formosanum]